MNRFPWNSAKFGNLLQRYRNTYHEPETSAEVDQKLLQIMEHVDGLLRQARGEDTEPNEITPVYRLLQRFRDASERRIPTSHLRVYGDVVAYIAERCRLARLDEHKILAGLDEEGRKQRYLELNHE